MSQQGQGQHHCRYAWLRVELPVQPATGYAGQVVTLVNVRAAHLFTDRVGSSAYAVATLRYTDGSVVRLWTERIETPLNSPEAVAQWGRLQESMRVIEGLLLDREKLDLPLATEAFVLRPLETDAGPRLDSPVVLSPARRQTLERLIDASNPVELFKEQPFL